MNKYIDINTMEKIFYSEIDRYIYVDWTNKKTIRGGLAKGPKYAIYSIHKDKVYFFGWASKKKIKRWTWDQVPKQTIVLYMCNGGVYVKGLLDNQKIIMRDYECPDDFDTEDLKTDSCGDTYQEIVLTKDDPDQR